SLEPLAHRDPSSAQPFRARHAPFSGRLNLKQTDRAAPTGDDEAVLIRASDLTGLSGLAGRRKTSTEKLHLLAAEGRERARAGVELWHHAHDGHARAREPGSNRGLDRCRAAQDRKQ